ncbi:MAG: acyl-CoA thioesterase [Succinivibrio sp.]
MYRRPSFIYKHESVFPISFHDTDAIKVVWHGNYFKFFELAREAMFEEFGYTYNEMKEDDIIYPVTECSCKFRRSLVITDKRLKVVSLLTEYEGKLVIHYEVYAEGSNALCAYGKTEQVAMNSKTMELLFDTPANLRKVIEKYEADHRE